MKKTNVGNLSVIALIVVVAISTVGRAAAQKQQSLTSTNAEKSLLQKGEKAASTRCDAAVATQRKHVASVGSLIRFRKFAAGVIDWEEKFAMSADALRTGDGSSARMQKLFHKHIIDETAFSKELVDAYMKLQRELIAETLEICRADGVSRENLLMTLDVWEIKKGAWTSVFEYVPRRAVAMSREDWFREILEFAGSDIAADVVEDTARRVGLWNHDEGSFGDALAKIATQLVVEAVVAEVTDPVGDIAKRLKSDFESCSKIVIDGKHGFREACVALTQHHIDSRRKLLGRAGKAVAK